MDGGSRRHRSDGDRMKIVVVIADVVLAVFEVIVIVIAVAEVAVMGHYGRCAGGHGGRTDRVKA